MKLRLYVKMINNYLLYYAIILLFIFLYVYNITVKQYTLSKIHINS